MSITQPKRTSYTRRDLQSYHDDVSTYFKEFIPRVKDTSEMNTGRVYLTLFEGLVDNLNFSVDQSFLELILETAEQRKNILRLSYALGYYPTSVSAASVDLTFSMQSGVAGGGGYSIPIYTRCQTVEAPLVEFFITQSATIPGGEASVDVPAIQGIRVVLESLSAGATGLANQEYILENARTPHSLIEVWVDSVKWEVVDDFTDSDDESQHYILAFDEDDYTHVIFGDGEFGHAPDSGSTIEATYVACAADQGNVEPEAISRIIGFTASDLVVTNDYAASGGAASESNDSIKRNAPAVRRSGDRVVTADDHASVATAMEGVYKAFAEHIEGTRTDVFLMPEGGGRASSYLIDTVQEELDEKKLDGAIPVVDALEEASILISVNVITKNSNILKSTVKKKIYDATTENLVYTELIKGRAFTRSDLSGIYEAIDDGKTVDYVDYAILSRVPRVEKSNALAPDIIDRVTISETTDYNTWLITALTTTTFVVTKDGAPQSTTGTVATSFSSDDTEVTFTLGETGDTFTVGDTWTFKTSRYSDNIVIDSNEYMQLEEASDLVISVFYPGEYSLTTKSAV